MIKPFSEIFEKEIYTLEKLKGGINNPTFEVTFTDKSKVILQLAGDKFPGKVKREEYIINLLKEEADVPVQEVLKTDTSGDILDRDYIVKSYIDGRTLESVGRR